MNRRGFCRTTVSFLGVASLPGCVLFGAGNGSRSYDLSLDSVGPGGLAEAAALGADDYAPEQRRLVANAVDGDEDAWVYGHRPIEDGAYVEYEGVYYRVSVEKTGEKSLSRPTLRGEYVDASEVESAVDIDRYIHSDRRAVKFALATAGDEGEFYVLRRDASETELLPEPEHEYLKYRERYVRLAVEERTVTETEYTYALEQVATSDAAFERRAAETVVTATFRPSDLTAEQEEMLRKASEDYYSEFDPISDEFRSLLERLGSGELPDGSLGTYVEYDGAYYRASMSVSVP
ncbi:hypothetical protein [Halorussus salinisoli]|uniref:hypothetical protein n=1 Tax=Halorussus salinisoli TaxID=2558242 RepID=UPI0010C22FF8|nr:hypothetical protein [Halorussus salinisoli]